MSEIKDLEQAFFILEHGSSEGVSKYLKAIKMIKEQCVQVVRCKDCRHYRPIGRATGICAINDVEHILFADWFCADGKRKDENRSD